MSENMGNDSYSAKTGKKDPFEEQKEQALSTLLNASLEFVAGDLRLNNMMEELFATIIGEVKKNPSVLFSSKGDNLETLIDVLKKRSEGGKGGTDFVGGDIIGGGPLSDIIDFIKEIGELADKEKQFFLKIIFMIFCGEKACECLCKCMCD